jgi:hypothetical protein
MLPSVGSYNEYCGSQARNESPERHFPGYHYSAFDGLASHGLLSRYRAGVHRDLNAVRLPGPKL